jgi:hypothetical protein
MNEQVEAMKAALDALNTIVLGTVGVGGRGSQGSIKMDYVFDAGPAIGKLMVRLTMRWSDAKAGAL